VIKEVVIEKEVIKVVPVEKIVHVEVLVTKEVRVPVEVIREVLVPVEKIVERLVEKEVETREKTTMNKPQVVKITEQVVRNVTESTFYREHIIYREHIQVLPNVTPPGVSSESHLLSPSLLSHHKSAQSLNLCVCVRDVIHLCVSGAAQIVEVERIREKIVYVDQVSPINCLCGRECRSVCPHESGPFLYPSRPPFFRRSLCLKC
jgi:hypothetical protein